jgi:phosphate:Na+ symporter
VMRDLRRINSYQTAVAYPILEEAGQLRSSRLRRSKASKDTRSDADDSTQRPANI